SSYAQCSSPGRRTLAGWLNEYVEIGLAPTFISRIRAIEVEGFHSARTQGRRDRLQLGDHVGSIHTEILAQAPRTEKRTAPTGAPTPFRDVLVPRQRPPRRRKRSGVSSTAIWSRSYRSDLPADRHRESRNRPSPRRPKEFPQVHRYRLEAGVASQL